MRTLVGLVRLLAAAIFAVIVTGSVTHAQRPTSEVRIPIHKGEHIAKVDTIYRVDTIPRYITDTLRLQGRTDTVRVSQQIVRIDTVWVKDRSCWSRVSLCTLGAVAGAVGTGILVSNCVRVWCKSEQHTAVDVGVYTTNRNRRRGYGLMISMPFARQ